MSDEPVAAHQVETPDGPGVLVYRNAAGEVLDMDFNVDDQVLAALPEGEGFRVLRALKEREPRSWVSPDVSFKLLCSLEERLAALS